MCPQSKKVKDKVTKKGKRLKVKDDKGLKKVKAENLDAEGEILKDKNKVKVKKSNENWK